jgi:putative hydrolase of the HAD superfamily
MLLLNKRLKFNKLNTLKKIKAISIDLDETLWPVMPTLQYAEQSLYDWLNTHAPKAALLSDDYSFVSQARSEIVKNFPSQVHDLSFVRQRLIERLLHESGESESLTLPAFEVFYVARQKVKLFSDALPFLQFAAARYPLIALSNGNADINMVGLGSLFSTSIHAHHVGVAKPDLKIFLEVARYCNVDPSEILHIGDDQILDVQGAINAGMHSIWINRQLQEWKGLCPKPLMISKLTDLIPLFNI